MTDPRPILRYTPFSITEVFEMDLPEPNFLIENILVEGSATILTGREKSGKGWHIIDMAACVATEVPYCGHAVHKSGPVLYMSLEESLRTLRNRFRHRLEGIAGASVDILPLDGFTEARFQLENVAHLKALTDLIQERGYVLVILDTLREAHAGRENDSDEMAPLIRRLRDIAHGLGVTVLVTHHQSKGMGQSRGSTAILASFDDEIAFSRSENSSDTSIKGSIRAEGRNLPKFVMHVDFDAATGRWRESDALEVPDDPSIRRRILDALDNSGKWLTAQDLATLIPGPSLKTIQNKLGDMRKETPMPFAESGTPTRSSPRKFHSLEQQMDLGRVVEFRKSQREEEPEGWQAV